MFCGGLAKLLWSDQNKSRCLREEEEEAKAWEKGLKSWVWSWCRPCLPYPLWSATSQIKESHDVHYVSHDGNESLYCVILCSHGTHDSYQIMPKYAQIHSQSIDSHRMFLQAQAWSRCRMELLHNKAWQGWWELANGLWMVMNGAADSSYLLCMIGFFCCAGWWLDVFSNSFKGWAGWMCFFLQELLSMWSRLSARSRQKDFLAGNWKACCRWTWFNDVQWCSICFNLFQYYFNLFYQNVFSASIYFNIISIYFKHFPDTSMYFNVCQLMVIRLFSSSLTIL